MRVLMLSWEFPPTSAGGTAAHVDGLAHALERAGHDVVVITRRVAGTEPDSTAAGVRVLRADVELPWLPDDEVANAASANHAMVATSGRLGEWRPDIVHAHDWNVAWAASVLASLFTTPIVTTFHGTERGRHGGHLSPGTPTDINSVEWWQAHCSRRVIASTKLMVREIVDGFEMDPEHVRRIPAGIDPAWWATAGPDEQPVDARGGVVLAWGRVQYEKGFQVLARAISALRYRVAGLECVIAGRGSYLPELQSQIDIAGVGDLIDLPGFLNDNELRAAIHRAGCVVIPSLYEPFGLVALEAIAAGAPLIVADTGGLAELVGGTGSALLFEPGNADALADCIERLLTDQQLADELVRRGQDLIEASYSWDAIAVRTVTVYHEALSP
ncbi:MAG: glycosyltransferase family 4 protein [Ilumatobacter sp.]|uniref:glycosyltransferase family 4 protein n=1 Tax=Ilumatobacter sp. TaxID=1967498 RepID=UPI00263982EF|nr:glycosyltransferase family 4 protein [Ilumatobacter sp.]MDJ0768827.1 glycosyltransferase family 4 protein [Ilumatobacter sp.]